MTTSPEISPPNPPKCRVAVIGLGHQRVARIISLLGTKFISPIQPYTPSESDLPNEIPPLVKIEYLPCVATFDSYEDEAGNNVRYLVKIEYHAEHGTLVKGKSLAPFFDDNEGVDGDDCPFPGIAAAAVGCGIDADEDVEKIASFINTLSTSCRQTIPDRTDHEINRELLIDCIKCNPEYTSMREENDAYRNLSEDEKKEAIANQTIGPGKMAKFVFELAQKVVHQRWSKELQKLEQDKHNKSLAAESTIENNLVSTEVTVQVQTEQLAINDTNDTAAHTESDRHIPDPNRVSYACKRCRTVLFGEADLEDPPHAQSLHNFRKKAPSKSMQSKVCANHFLSGPLPWMNAMDGMEGKLHCFKCETKIGHYSWTGAQCSCGTWVTPAIMVPMSKVDEMKPGGSLIFDASQVGGVVRLAPLNEIVKSE